MAREDSDLLHTLAPAPAGGGRTDFRTRLGGNNVSREGVSKIAAGVFGAKALVTEPEARSTLLLTQLIDTVDDIVD
jgi:hypothetical protein